MRRVLKQGPGDTRRAAAGLSHLTRVVKRGLKKIRYRANHCGRAVPADDVIELDVRAGEHHCLITFQPNDQVLLCPDQDPLVAPAQIILSPLGTLAPQVPAIWFHRLRWRPRTHRPRS